MKLQRFKEFNEAIYAINWKEKYEETKCFTFDLDINDKFEISTGAKARYIDEEKPTIIIYYKGKTSDNIYFTYDINSDVIYKISKNELENNFIQKY